MSRVFATAVSVAGGDSALLDHENLRVSVTSAYSDENEMANTYFLGMVLGVPLTICLLAILVGHLNRGRDAEVLDWKPARPPEREAELELDEIDQTRAST